MDTLKVEMIYLTPQTHMYIIDCEYRTRTKHTHTYRQTNIYVSRVEINNKQSKIKDFSDEISSSKWRNQNGAHKATSWINQILSLKWWHLGILALGKASTACEEGDTVTLTRRKMRKQRKYQKTIRKPVNLLMVRQSTIPGAGLGLFANKDICFWKDMDNGDSILHRYTGPLGEYKASQAVTQGSDYILEIEGMQVDALHSECDAKYANECLDLDKDCNTYFKKVGRKMYLFAIKGIEIVAGDELFVAYGPEYWFGKWHQWNHTLRAQILIKYAHPEPNTRYTSKDRFPIVDILEANSQSIKIKYSKVNETETCETTALAINQTYTDTKKVGSSETHTATKCVRKLLGLDKQTKEVHIIDTNEDESEHSCDQVKASKIGSIVCNHSTISSVHMIQDNIDKSQDNTTIYNRNNECNSVKKEKVVPTETNVDDGKSSTINTINIGNADCTQTKSQQHNNTLLAHHITLHESQNTLDYNTVTEIQRRIVEKSETLCLQINENKAKNTQTDRLGTSDYNKTSREDINHSNSQKIPLNAEFVVDAEISNRLQVYVGKSKDETVALQLYTQTNDVRDTLMQAGNIKEWTIRQNFLLLIKPEFGWMSNTRADGTCGWVMAVQAEVRGNSQNVRLSAREKDNLALQVNLATESTVERESFVQRITQRASEHDERLRKHFLSTNDYEMHQATTATKDMTEWFLQHYPVSSRTPHPFYSPIVGIRQGWFKARWLPLWSAPHVKYTLFTECTENQSVHVTLREKYVQATITNNSCRAIHTWNQAQQIIADNNFFANQNLHYFLVPTHDIAAELLKLAEALDDIVLQLQQIYGNGLVSEITQPTVMIVEGALENNTWLILPAAPRLWNKNKMILPLTPRYHTQGKRVKTNVYSDSVNKNFIENCKRLSIAYTTTDMGMVGNKEEKADLKIGFLNVRGPLTTVKIELICWYFKALQKDILFLLDVGLNRNSVFFAKQQIKGRLGTQVGVISTYDKKHDNTISNVGGQIAICAWQVMTHITKVVVDPSGLGIYLSLGIQLREQMQWVMGIYWPSAEHGEKGLWKLYQRYMYEENIGVMQTVSEYIKHTTGQLVLKKLNAGEPTIIGGDWNANWIENTQTQRRSHHGLEEWAREYGLKNFISEMSNEIYTTRFTTTQASSIDHILTTSSVICVRGGVDHSPLWQAHTDHRPIWIHVKLLSKFHIPKLDITQLYGEVSSGSTRKVRRAELDRTNVGAVQEFHSQLTKYVEERGYLRQVDDMTVHQLSNMTEFVCRQTVILTRQTMRKLIKGNKNMRDGWSPVYSVLVHHLCSILEIRRHLLGQHKRKKWTSEDEIKKGVEQFIEEWVRAAQQYEWESETDYKKMLHKTGKGPSFWTDNIPTEELLNSEITVLLKKMHGRRRTEYRKHINDAVKNRDKGMQNKQMKKSLNSMINQNQQVYTMESINTGEEEVEYRPTSVHDGHTDSFSTWFSHDNETTGTLHGSESNWLGALNDKKIYDNLIFQAMELRKESNPQYQDIPEEYIGYLWKTLHTMKTNLTNQQSEQLKEVIEKPPSFEEWKSRTKCAKGGMTAGPSELTYNMMAEWPEAVLELMYKAFSKLHLARHTPDFWVIRWLVPLAKCDNPTLADLRPLMMVEVSRKLWYSFGIKAIWVFLEKHNLLAVNQYAYRVNREGPVAQLYLQNLREEAAETESVLLLNSFDKVHAFDNVTRNAAKLTMVAKGIDFTYVDRLADLDKDGHVYVRSPVAHALWAESLAKYPDKTMEEIRISNPQLKTVKTQKGIAQGDLPSCLQYNIFEDVTLTALNNDPERERLYIRGKAGQLVEVKDMSYADDLNTVAGTVKGQQRKSDIVGYFSDIFYTKLNIKKLKASALNYGNEPLLQSNAHLTINDGTGKFTKLALPKVVDYPQLGYTATLEVTQQANDLKSYYNLRELTAQLCNIIIKKNATIITKLITYNVKVEPKLIYKYRPHALTLEHARTLEKPINRLHRHCTKNLHSFPTLLLYSPAPGLNLRRFSDEAICANINLLYRTLENPKEIGACAHGLIQRAARFDGLSPAPREAVTIRTVPTKHYYLRAISERLEECAIQVAMGGRNPMESYQEPIITHLSKTKTTENGSKILNSKNINRLETLDIKTYGDLIEETPTSNRKKWIHMKRGLGLKFLDNLIMTNRRHKPPPIGERLLRVNTCWESVKHNAVMEYLGQVLENKEDTPRLIFRKWIPIKDEQIQNTKTVKLCPTSYSRLAGTDIVLTYAEVWEEQEVARCILDKEEFVIDENLDEYIKRKVLYRAFATPPRLGTMDDILPKQSTLIEVEQEMQNKGFRTNEYTMFTDGSYTDNTDFITATFYGKNIQANCSGAAIVLVQDGITDFFSRQTIAIRVTNNKQAYLTSAYPTELIALLVAAYLSKHTLPSNIWTDCESLLTTIKGNKRQTKSLSKDYMVLIKHLTDLASTLNLSKITKHVRSHEGEELPEELQTEQQKGNYLADLLAGGKIEEVNGKCANITNFSIEFTDFLEVDVKQNITLHFVKEGKILLKAIKSCLKDQMFEEYTNTRTVNSSAGQHWKNTTYHLANTAWDLTSKDIGRNSQAVRIIFNKLWITWNISRYSKEPNKVSPICNICCNGTDDSLQHLLCGCLHPHIIGLRYNNQGERYKLTADNAQDDIIVQVFEILENMIRTDPESSLIYISTWNKRQVETFKNRLTECHSININNIIHKTKITKAIHQFAMILSENTRQLIMQRLDFNKQSSKPFGPSTRMTHYHKFCRSTHEKKRVKPKKKQRNSKEKSKIQTLHQYYLKAQRHAEDKLETVQQQLHQKYQHDWKDDFGIRPTDLVPYLAEHESAPAKTANAEKRHFAWMRLKYPKRKPKPQFTPEEELDREQKILEKRKNSLRIFRERIKRNAEIDKANKDKMIQSKSSLPITPPYFDYG